MALKLHSVNHHGTISMFSRSGLLPTVLGKEVPSYTLKYLTMEAIKQITESGKKNLPLATLTDLFTCELQEALGKDFKLQDIIQSYQQMSALDWIEKEILDNAYKIHALLKSGQLKVYGGVQNIVGRPISIQRPEAAGHRGIGFTRRLRQAASLLLYFRYKMRP